MKTDKELVADCNALARDFYALMGYTIREGYRFDKATHPQERMVWQMAVTAYDRIQGTDIENALAEAGED